MTVANAISVAKLHLVSKGEVDEALRVLVEEVQRYRQALQWYANGDHWLEGMAGCHGDDGQWQDDEGVQARIALRLVDIAGVPSPAPERAVADSRA